MPTTFTGPMIMNTADSPRFLEKLSEKWVLSSGSSVPYHA